MAGGAEREERLREMGLSPIWRLREPAVAALPLGPPAVGAVAEALPPSPIADARSIANPAVIPVVDARAAGIAGCAWNELDSHIAACTACGLSRTRRKTVPGVGAAPAGWMFVGEGPGAEEDAQGEPFVGQAGRLLDNMLLAIGLQRTEGIYITNVVKCRPPNNRNPEPQEIAQCATYLERQIALVRPRLLVALGRFAAQALLATDAPIGSLRGRVHTYRGTPLIVTYHPAYLLRTLPDKAKAWEDLALAKRTFAQLQSTQQAPS